MGAKYKVGDWVTIKGDKCYTVIIPPDIIESNYFHQFKGLGD